MKSEEKISIHQVLWYFIIFSVIGLFIETIYCFATTGVLESRKGLIWGPFCPVYGIGATFLIIVLNKFKDSKIKVFLLGGIAGDILEYLMSYVLEAIYMTRFWDYSYTNFHLNGRICFTYTLFWAILSVTLIYIAKPFIDRHLFNIQFKYISVLEIAIAIFLFIDAVCTTWAISLYKQRAMDIYYKNDAKNTSYISTRLENTLFSDEKMLKTFPNIRFRNDNNEEIWIRELIKE